MTPLPYDVILQIDRDIHTIMNEAPLWMRDENYILDPSAPSWADWQRKAYLASTSESLKKQHTNIPSQLSASHKVSCQYTRYRARALIIIRSLSFIVLIWVGPFEVINVISGLER